MVYLANEKTITQEICRCTEKKGVLLGNARAGISFFFLSSSNGVEGCIQILDQILHIFYSDT